MTTLTALQDLRDAGRRNLLADIETAKAHRDFGKFIATNRKVSRSKFAHKLGVTGSMLALMESGKRRWPLKRAELAVKLLTRRENWPDASTHG